MVILRQIHSASKIIRQLGALWRGLGLKGPKSMFDDWDTPLLG
jgi:hypothetical protein